MLFHNFLKKNSYLYFIFFFTTCLIFFYRDFLYDYRMALENTLGYWPYQNQIIFYETGDKNFDITAPANLRFLGLIVQYLIFKLFPCIELVSVNINPNLSPIGNVQYLHPEYVCATYSNALMNYLSLCAILTVTFFYCEKKLKLNLSENFLTILITYAFLQHLESFTLDRISVFYFLIILYFLDKKYLAITLIIFASLVNEKIVFILIILFFIRFFFNKEKNYRDFFISALISSILVILIFLFYTKFLGHGYWNSNLDDSLYNTAFTIKGLQRIFSMFLSKSGYSNTVLPLIFAISPYIFSIFFKIDKIYFSNLEILIPCSLLIFCMGGGMTNGGRYMHTLPLWAPILSIHLCNFIKFSKTY